jgi:hypothetical protein
MAMAQTNLIADVLQFKATAGQFSFSVKMLILT